VLSDFLPFVVIGITTGAVYGLAGTGLVLTYKTTGIFNFAYGSLAALSVFVFYFLHDRHHLAWPLAALLCVGVMGPVEGLLLERVTRPLEHVGALLKTVATVGLLLVVLGIGTIWYGNNVTTFPQFLPQTPVRILGVNVGYDQIIVVAVSVAATVALWLFFRYLRLGIAMRGIVDNPDLVAMTGESPNRVRRSAWVIGTMFASLAGLLLAPSLSLDALIITMLVVQAFGAAAIGYLSSLPLTFVGGLVIGLAGSIATKYVVSVNWLSGLPAGLPFIILFVVLLVTPKALLVERRALRARPVHLPYYAPARVRLAAGAVALAFALAVPAFAGADLSVWSNALVDTILFLSLGLLVRTSGQLSLCQLAFAAVGAAAFGHLLDDAHLPWLLALAVAGLVAVPVGALVAIPAIRLSGVFLALATFGFGILLEQMVYTTGIMFGPTTSGIPVSRPGVDLGPWHLASASGFYYVLLVAVLLTVALVTAIQRGRMGRLLGALADSPTALEVHGASTIVARVVVFCISAFLASVAGALTSSLFHYAVGANFSSFNSLVLVALVVITEVGDPWYALLAALGYAVVPGYLTITNISTYLEILFGVFAVAYALRSEHAPSFPESLRTLLDRLGGRATAAPPALARVPALAGASAFAGSPPPAAPGPGTPSEPAAAVAASPAGGSAALAGDGARAAAGTGLGAPEAGRQPTRSRSLGLEVRDVVVNFGGIQAVAGVSLDAPIGVVTGLVGPNGAGKTTIFNVCSGLQRPTRGKVRFAGVDVTRASPAVRAQLGLGRTFQRAELFDSLTVEQNVGLGREAAIAGRNPATQLFGRPGDRAEVRAALEEAVALTGIEDLLPLQAGLLSTGQRRLVELARALAAPFKLLLLDEPSAGLDSAETRRFGEVLARVTDERGIGIFLVEHDMALVRAVCEQVYVLDFGQLIFEGTPEEMARSEAVKLAYLGSALEEPRTAAEPAARPEPAGSHEHA
jgi:ABC-type branched-subunit amino acid transport system ATPase component/branched-subunit amino acid ABC-type transport system permease component